MSGKIKLAAFTALLVIGGLPVIATASPPAAYVDAAIALSIPPCSLDEFCDAEPGICEFREHYHLPETELANDQLAMATELDSNASAVYTAEDF